LSCTPDAHDRNVSEQHSFHSAGNKSSISDIIQNFQREKNAFNSKLQNLKAKLNDLDLTNDEQKIM
jgi:hypothetical protein